MKPDIKAKLKYVGNTLPIYSGIRPVAKIKDDYLTSIQIDFENDNILSNREIIDVFVTFITPEAYPNTLWKGKTIRLQDPSNLWGYLTVTEVYNQMLLAPEAVQEARED